MVYIPVSRFAMIISSPNLPFPHAELEWITPLFSSNIKSHERVVCNFFPLLGKIDTTSGCSEHIYIHSLVYFFF